MAVKTGLGPYVAAIIGPPGPSVGGTSFRVTGHFGLERSTLIVVALVLRRGPSLSLASQTLSGVWLARLPSQSKVEGQPLQRMRRTWCAQRLSRKYVPKTFCPKR